MKIPVALTLIMIAGCTASAEACNVDPAMFCEPFKTLKSEMPDSVEKELLALPKEDYWKLHHGFGTGIRNRFGLWQDNELTQFFRANGIAHPEGMSGPFIAGYVLYLQRKPVVMKDLLAAHRPPPPPPPPPPPEPKGD